MKNKIKIMRITNEGELAIMFIDNTLEAFQQEVEGYIECVPVVGDILAICNEEGLIKGLPLTLATCGGFGLLHGNIVFCEQDGEEFAGLSDNSLQLLHKLLFYRDGLWRL